MTKLISTQSLERGSGGCILNPKQVPSLKAEVFNTGCSSESSKMLLQLWDAGDPPGGLLWWISNTESACMVGDMVSIPGLGRWSREENSNPLQYSCMRNPMEKGVWQATGHGVTKNQTQPSD